MPSRHDAVTGHPGREGFNYGLLNADVVKPRRASKVNAGYAAVSGKHGLAGNSVAWQEGVGDLVRGHELPMFAAMLALTAAVSEMLSIGEPTLVQIVGRPGSGRRDMLRVAASVSGSFLRGPLPFYELLADPAAIISGSRGDILLAGDPCLAFSADSPARRQTATLALLRAWLGSRAGTRICLFSGDRPLAEWAEVGSEVHDLASRHVITLRIDEARPFGAFNTMGEAGAFAFSKQLANAAREAHGGPFRKFVRSLVQECSVDEPGFRERLQAHIDAFVTGMGADLNDRTAMRDAQFFGLVYATGYHARRIGVLPADWRVGRAIAQCYRRHLVRAGVTRSAQEIVGEIAVAETTIRLDADPTPSREVIESSHACVRGEGARRKVFVRQTSIEQFPELHRILYQEATKALLLKPDPVSSRQRLGAAELTRVYAFAAPE